MEAQRQSFRLTEPPPGKDKFAADASPPRDSNLSCVRPSTGTPFPSRSSTGTSNTSTTATDRFLVRGNKLPAVTLPKLQPLTLHPANCSSPSTPSTPRSVTSPSTSSSPKFASGSPRALYRLAPSPIAEEAEKGLSPRPSTELSPETATSPRKVSRSGIKPIVPEKPRFFPSSFNYNTSSSAEPVSSSGRNRAAAKNSFGGHRQQSSKPAEEGVSTSLQFASQPRSSCKVYQTPRGQAQTPVEDKKSPDVIEFRAKSETTVDLLRRRGSRDATFNLCESITRPSSEKSRLFGGVGGQRAYFVKQSRLPSDDVIGQAEVEGNTIIQKIYLHAAADLNSHEPKKVEHARLMLHRLKQAGFEARPKSLSHPLPSTVASPTITVTVAPVISPPSAASTPLLDKSDQSWPPTADESLSDHEPGTSSGYSSFGSARKSPNSSSGQGQVQGRGSLAEYAGNLISAVSEERGSDRSGRQYKGMSSSRSDPNLYKKSSLPLSVLLGAMETAPMARRKDSVISFRKRSSVPMLRKGSFVSVQPVSRNAGLRRHSCRELLGLSSHAVSPLPFDLQTDEPDATTWSVLMSSLPPEERRMSQIRRQHLVISVPVCVVGKDNPVTFTSMEAIERTLRRLHPEIVVKKKAMSEDFQSLAVAKQNNCIKEQSRSPSPSATPSLSPRRDRKKAVITPPLSRHVSISSCITSMRTVPKDYQIQVEGIQTIGAFAEEETLKVLFAKSDAIGCIIEAMNQFPEREELQLQACTSLLKMASASVSNCVHILRNNGVSAISSGLRRHLDNSGIVRKLINIVFYISTSVDLAEALVAGGVHSDILSVMSRHASDKEIVKESCFIIGNLLVTEETAHQLMLVGGVHTIIQLVQKFPNDEDILENACRTLGSFAIHDETCLDVARAGATAAVLDAVSSSRTNVAVFECGFWALASLTASPVTCQEVVSLGGVPVILSVLGEQPQEESLQEYGMRALYNLSSSEVTASAVSVQPTPRLVQQVLTNFPDSVELLEITMATLSQVMLGDEHLYKTLTRTHCVVDIVSTMANFPENTLIQESGCKVLGNLAVRDDLRKLVEADGASKAVISALLTLDTCADIQEVGCIALMNLTADSEDNKIRIKNTGAVPALLNTLKEFHYSGDVVLCALKALGNLVSLDEVCHQLVDEGGLDQLISLIDAHESNREVLIFVSLALCSITDLPDLHADHVAVIDSRLMSILTQVPCNPDINLYVCQAFHNLIKSDVGMDIFVKGNRLKVILTAMKTFRDNSQIHHCCCKVIAVISLSVDIRKNLISGTTLESVLCSMELFPNDLELQIIGCGTLACMLEKTYTLRESLVERGGITLIGRALTNHTADSRLAVVAVMALDHLMPIDSLHHAHNASLAKQTILKCMRTFSENKEVQIFGCRALGKLDISVESDVIEVAQNVIEAIRRHGREPEVQKSAAAALRPYYKLEPYSGLLDKALHSPTVKPSQSFWNDVNQ